MTLRWRTSLWVGVCLGFFLISRAPAMLCPFQLNVDEGQMLAQAMRYAQDLTPWRAVDGETGGPILSWFLLLGHDGGLPFNFRTEHVLAALCLAGTLLATFAAARRLVGEEPARLALAAGSLWLALIPDPDFSHYSSELVPDLFIALALLGLVGPPRPKEGGGVRILFAGLFLGLVPWAKLQAVPIALLLGLWALVGLMRGGGGAVSERRGRHAHFLIVGALLPTALLLSWIAQAGAWGQFWHSYILANLSRAGGKPWSLQGTNLIHLLLFQPGAPWFLGVGLLALGALVLRGRAGWRMAPRGVLILAVLLSTAAVFAIFRPVIAYSHYEQLCLVPLLLLVAGCARILIGDDAVAGDPRRNAGWIIMAIGLVPLPIAYFCHYDGWRILVETWRYDQSPAFQPQVFVDRAVRHFVPDATSLVVWGWAPYLYVDLGIPPGTRDAGYASMTDGNPSEAFIRAGFLGDLAKSPPQVIVDTEDYIAGGLRKTAPEIFPAFAAYLRSHYQLIGRGTITRGPDLSLLVDVYLRRP